LSSTPQSLLTHPPSTPLEDNFEVTHVSPEAEEIDVSQCEFDIDWENIWHSGKRLVGVKKIPRHKRVIGTKI
jgi:hypothetical protein